MANPNWDVIYGGEVNGKLDGTQVPIIVSAAPAVGTDGAPRASEGNLITAIVAAGLHNKKANIVHKLYKAVLREDKTIPNQA